VRPLPLVVAALVALAGASGADAYSWPLKPFTRPHPIRGSFGDPRYHLGPEAELSSFHFGVDIVTSDGTAVYSVEPGYVHAYAARLTVTARSSREFGYWHVKPVVHTGMHVRRHQLIGHVMPGWGHVHFAERYRGNYKDPLRKGALTPFYDHTQPVVEPLQVTTPEGGGVDPSHVSGPIAVTSGIYDLPPIAPPPPWQVARLVPSRIAWAISDATGVFESGVVADFSLGILPNSAYGLVYAPGTYQNKANRPGRYLFWITHGLDTTALPDGTWTLTVSATDTRNNVGTASVQLRTANGTSYYAGLPPRGGTTRLRPATAW
jgi:murein DD-endopeptidase MepM/ murein hydrolase activator NlpD